MPLQHDLYTGRSSFPQSPGLVHYAYRAPDGSNYNPLIPGVGRVGSPYARSSPSTSVTPRASLPHPGLIFDTLLKRDKFVPHPDGISSLFFAFADLVIHSIFNTDPRDPKINQTSSYLDLSVLYGNSEEELAGVRAADGSGKLKPDCFADIRLLMMPPASCALLILLNRNHNVLMSISVSVSSAFKLNICFSSLLRSSSISMNLENSRILRSLTIKNGKRKMMKFSTALVLLTVDISCGSSLVVYSICFKQRACLIRTQTMLVPFSVLCGMGMTGDLTLSW